MSLKIDNQWIEFASKDHIKDIINYLENEHIETDKSFIISYNNYIKEVQRVVQKPHFAKKLYKLMNKKEAKELRQMLLEDLSILYTNKESLNIIKENCYIITKINKAINNV